VSKTGEFWHHKTERSFGKNETQIYEIFDLKESPYTISVDDINLHSKSSIVVRLEPVFSNEVVWPFIEKNNTEKDFVVLPLNTNGDHYTIPQFSGNHLRKEYLQDNFKDNPLALLKFKEAIGSQISPELQIKADEYIHAAAFSALNLMKENYLRIKLNDKEIQKIEDQYNSPQKETGMYATRPVIPDMEPDPFMAKLMSHDARTSRDSAYKSLTSCIIDLNSTGLINYSKPIEKRVMQGEKTIYNLAEFSDYIKNIFELKVFSKEEKVFS
jgi:hypothetical protein